MSNILNMKFNVTEEGIYQALLKSWQVWTQNVNEEQIEKLILRMELVNMETGEIVNKSEFLTIKGVEIMCDKLMRYFEDEDIDNVEELLNLMERKNFYVNFIKNGDYLNIQFLSNPEQNVTTETIF